MDNNTQIQTLHSLHCERTAALQRADKVSSAIDLLRELWGISEDDFKAAIQSSESSNGNSVKPVIELEKQKANDTTQPSAKVKITGNYDNYPLNGSNLDKAVFILKAENRFLHVREMTNIALGVEKTGDLEVFKRKFSPTLSIEVKKPDNVVVSKRIGESQNNTLYGMPYFLSENGKILQEHLYDENALQYKPKLNLQLYGGVETIKDETDNGNNSEFTNGVNRVFISSSSETEKAAEAAVQNN